VLGDRLWQRIAVLATVVATTSLGVGLWANATGRPWQSMLFVALGATQLGIGLGVRARPGTLANPFLLWAVLAAFVLQVAALYVPPLPELLGTTALGGADLALVSATAVLGYLAARLDVLRHGVVSARGPAVPLRPAPTASPAQPASTRTTGRDARSDRPPGRATR
jgi:P-type Ca2+ transporter type 2C